MLLTTLVGIFVVEECFRLILLSSVNKALVWICVSVSLTKIMNFTAADENSQINNKRQRGIRGEQNHGGTKLNEGKGTEKNLSIINGNV